MKEAFEHFYEEKLGKFGPSAQGVGWKNEEAQHIRFEQLLRIIREDNFMINDLGCGTGNLVDYMKRKGYRFDYYGYDVMGQMIKEALTSHLNDPSVAFKEIKTAGEMREAQYTIASGIFNIRFDTDDSTWLSYIYDTLDAMDRKSSHGFAFNALTKYSDPELMRKELYYADPGKLFDYCKRNFSRNVALLHDYDIYDFTILVRKII